MQTHELTPGKPCEGGGFCCDRPLFDRQMFPCDVNRVLRATRRQNDAMRKALELVKRWCECNQREKSVIYKAVCDAISPGA